MTGPTGNGDVGVGGEPFAKRHQSASIGWSMVLLNGLKKHKQRGLGSGFCDMWHLIL